MSIQTQSFANSFPVLVAGRGWFFEDVKRLDRIKLRVRVNPSADLPGCAPATPKPHR
jgi:hypothetical protein